MTFRLNDPQLRQQFYKTQVQVFDSVLYLVSGPLLLAIIILVVVFVTSYLEEIMFLNFIPLADFGVLIIWMLYLTKRRKSKNLKPLPIFWLLIYSLQLNMSLWASRDHFATQCANFLLGQPGLESRFAISSMLIVQDPVLYLFIVVPIYLLSSICSLIYLSITLGNAAEESELKLWQGIVIQQAMRIMIFCLLTCVA